jgi:hypothetical protein
MKNGSFVLALCEIGPLLQSQGYITAAGDFDDTKFANIAADLALGEGVIAILQKHGVTMAPNVTKVLASLPLVAQLITALTA